MLFDGGGLLNWPTRDAIRNIQCVCEWSICWGNSNIFFSTHFVNEQHWTSYENQMNEKHHSYSNLFWAIIYIFPTHTTCIHTIHFNSNLNLNSNLNSLCQIFTFKKWLSTINTRRRWRLFCVSQFFSILFGSVSYFILFYIQLILAHHIITYLLHISFVLSFSFVCIRENLLFLVSQYFYLLRTIRATCKIVLFHMLFWLHVGRMSMLSLTFSSNSTVHTCIGVKAASVLQCYLVSICLRALFISVFLLFSYDLFSASCFRVCLVVFECYYYCCCCYSFSMSTHTQF